MSRDRGAFETRPAPVVTDEGAFGPLPPMADARGRVPRPRSRVRRAAAQLAVGIALWLLVFSAVQISTRATALPALERILAALTDVDGLLLTQERAVRAAAAQPGATSVAVPGFPIPAATLAVDEARSNTRAQWRTTLLEAGAAALYAQGMAAFTQEGRGSDGGLLSTAGNTTALIDSLSAERNRTATIATALMGLGVLTLGARVIRLGEGASRFVAVGMAVVAGAALAAAASVVTATFLLAAGLFGTSQLGNEVVAVSRALAWTPLRDALPLAAAGLVIALVSGVTALWLGTRLDEEDLEADWD